MADTTIKKWNDTSNQWEELYPETTVSQLIATGDRDSTTFLRGDGVFSDTLTDDLKLTNTSELTLLLNGQTYGSSLLVDSSNNTFLNARGGSGKTLTLRTYSGSAWNTGLVMDDSGDVTLSGNLTLEDHVLKVGDVSADNYLQLQQTGDGFGFDFEHNNASTFQNLQGSLNQALVLGDTSSGNTSTLLGASIYSGSWTKKFNLTGAGELYIGSSGTDQVWHNGIFEPIVDNLDVLPTYTQSNEDYIKYNTTERAIEVQGADTTFGAVFPAMKTESGVSWKISFSIKSNTTTTSGVYFRIQEYDGALANGKTHTAANATHSEVQEATRQVTSFYENSGVTTSWSQHSFFYTPTSTTSWFSPLFLNWTGLSTNSLYIKNLRIFAIQEDSADANTLDGIDSTQFLRSDISDTMSGNLTIGNNYIYGDLATTKLRVGSQAEFATVRSMEIRADDDDSSNTEYLKLMAGQNTLQVTSTSGGGTDSNKLTYNGNTVWHSGNDGSGSGLDADTLDTLEATQFLRSDQSDTMTGNLTLSGSNVNTSLTINSGTASSIINMNGTGTSFIEKDTGNDLYIAHNVSDKNIHFRVNDGGTQNVLMTLNGSSSRVGIGTGTSNPAAKLHIIETTSGADIAKFRNNTDTADVTIKTSGEVGFVKGGAGDQLQLSANGTDNNGIRITTAGDIGVGTTSPSTKMHISESSTATALTVQNASSNGTVVKLTSTGDNRNLYLQTDHIYSNGALYLGDNSYDTIIRGSVVKYDTPNLYLNNNNSPTDTDTSIYFGDDQSDTAHYMQFDDSSQLFKFSDDIYALGHVYADNHVYAKGEIRINYDNTGDAILRFGDAASDTAHYMNFSNAAQQYYLSDTLNVYGGVKLDHNGTGTVDSHAITFTSQFSSTDVVRELKTNSSGDLLFNGNELATESYVDTAVSGAGGGVTSIKNFTNYVASAGTSARQLNITKSLSIGDKIGLVVQTGSTSNYGTRSQEIIWVEVGTSSHTVQTSYYFTSTSTARWYAFEVYISSGNLYIDDAVAWTNGSFGHSGSNSSAIYILDVLELT